MGGDVLGAAVGCGGERGYGARVTGVSQTMASRLLNVGEGGKWLLRLPPEPTVGSRD